MKKPRARDLGIPFEGNTGKYNAITDVAGVEVGYSTIIEGESARTGVTIIHPRGKANHDPVFAAWFPFNGNGEMTGAAWVEEGGFLEGPIGITNTHSVGIVRDTIIEWQAENNALFQKWSCPVVAETADGWLNDMNGFFVKPHHAREALRKAESGPLEEGNVGGGTGMMSYEFKGGSGTSSRKLPERFGGWMVGAFAQSNFGVRYQLTIAGVPVGRYLTEHSAWTNGENPYKQEQGSLIVVIATDAPVLPHQLKRIAKRVSLGMARTGSLGGNGSGDIFLAFSTANPNAALAGKSGVVDLKALDNERLNPLLHATVFATEEAIINSMVAAEDMTGHLGFSVKALPHEELKKVFLPYMKDFYRKAR
ncbi:MAG: P1 family peptidase [Anaerolineae bacterium]|nr:P1 family peptidase [Anaerolineae bacterium]MBL8104137.1 P1 family peptidase [Anaerolineales bacterium]MCC7187538.1 P1 family peptidase [Anaerolineales bacterium]